MGPDAKTGGSIAGTTTRFAGGRIKVSGGVSQRLISGLPVVHPEPLKWQAVSLQIGGILASRLRDRVLYRWNQADPQSATILKWLIVMLSIGLTEFYWRSQPSMALTSGLCIGVLIGQIVPPRLTLGRLIIAVSGALVLGAALTVLHR